MFAINFDLHIIDLIGDMHICATTDTGGDEEYQNNDDQLALETLAGTGSIELETHSDSRARLNLPDLRDRLDEYNRLASRYHPYWPQAEMRAPLVPGSPIRLLDRALRRLRSWEDEAAPRVHQLESLTGEQSDLQLLETMLLQVENDTLDFSLLASI